MRLVRRLISIGRRIDLPSCAIGVIVALTSQWPEARPR